MTNNALKIDTRKLNYNALDGDELWLCIAQIRRELNENERDAPNIAAVELLETLLRVEGNFASLDADVSVSDGALRVVVLPELALGSPDRARIDAAVAAYNRPLLLISGVGFPTAATVRAEIPSFPETASDDRCVNFGCAWLNLPGPQGKLTQRLQYCKNHCEQAVEVPQYDPVQGTHILAIEFNDLNVFPVICADLLQTSTAERPSVLDRVKAQALSAAGKANLLVGSLLQETPWHGIWSTHMDSAVQVTGGALVLANIAQDARPASFTDDPPRNLSGAYTATAVHKNKQPNVFCAVGRHGATLSGVALRDCMSMVAAGPLRLRNYSAVNAHVWMPRWSKDFRDGKLVSHPKDCLHYEWPRLKKRIRHATVPVPTAVDRVMQRLAAVDLARSKTFFASVLYGVDSPPAMVDPVETAETNEATEQGVKAADALAATDAFHWPNAGDGTLLCRIAIDQTPLEISTYTWRSADKDWQYMQARLLEYSNDTQPRPAIVVFAADRNNTSLDEDLGVRDIALPTTNSDVTTARVSTNTVVYLPLHKAGRLGEFIGAGQFEERAAEIMSTIANRVGGWS